MTFDRPTIEILKTRQGIPMDALGTITKGMLVQGSTTGVVVATAASDCLGVALNDATSGDKVTIANSGVYDILVEAGIAAVINVGDRLKVKNSTTLEADSSTPTADAVAIALEQNDNGAGMVASSVRIRVMFTTK